MEHFEDLGLHHVMLGQLGCELKAVTFLDCRCLFLKPGIYVCGVKAEIFRSELVVAKAR